MKLSQPSKGQNYHCRRLLSCVLGCLLLVTCYFAYSMYNFLVEPADTETVTSSKLSAAMSSWKLKEFEPLRNDIISGSSRITVEEHTLTLMAGGQSVTVHYKETRPESRTKLHVLFLHGASFSSATWKEIGTLQLLATLGYRAVAVDLPGYGKSRSAYVDEKEFMKQFITETKLDRPVLICASMSGGYALSYLLKPDADSCQQRLRGFVPIAPVGTSSFSDTEYRQCKVPTMIVYGERDRGAPVETLHKMPNSEVFPIKNAGHACYMNDTPEWHRLLYNFLAAVERI